jgi:hypothetical protein
VAAWIADVVQQSRATMRLLADCSGKPDRVEERLLKLVRQSTGARRLAALRVLTPNATVRALPVLREAATSPELVDLVLPALLRLEDAQTLGQLAFAEPDTHRRRRILIALWESEDRSAPEIAFQFVRDRARRAEATAALGDAQRPPIDWLCEVVLRSPRATERTIAAQLLGGLDRPDVSMLLIEMTENASSRPAAIAGLVSSSEQSARGFLSSAEDNPYLVASIWTARRHQAEVINNLGDTNHETH